MPQDLSTYSLLPETAEHAEAVDRLYDAVFGPGRFAKTAERLRESNQPIGKACLVAVDDQGLTGVVRLWPVLVGDTQVAAFLGPLAVAERRRRNGVAFALMEAAIAECARQGFAAVILVGDESYYSRAGFARSAPGRFSFPGPVDPARILVRELTPGAQTLEGALSVPRGARPAS